MWASVLTQRGKGGGGGGGGERERERERERKEWWGGVDTVSKIMQRRRNDVRKKLLVAEVMLFGDSCLLFSFVLFLLLVCLFVVGFFSTHSISGA